MTAPKPPLADLFLDTDRLTNRDSMAALGLSHSPVTSLVVPRPIGWISTLSRAGVANLAPFSFFNMVSQSPPMVMFCANAAHSDGGDKDSLRNARETGEFVANLATWDLREKMNITSSPAPRGMDEFQVAGLAKAPSRIVRAPRVAESPISLECKVIQFVDLPKDERSGVANTATFGRVVGVHIHAGLIADGRVQSHKAMPLARLGYLDYSVLGEIFVMNRPAWPVNGK
jgi:flavin reductase (DIM6/NTAB) family NADH-FMN oxidoreductase RutF